MRPHLEFAQCVWSPNLKRHQDNLERVQERATKLVDHMNGIEYKERLKALNLSTLSFRRFRGDMIEMYKHFNKYDICESFQPKHRSSRQHDFHVHERIANDGERGVLNNSFYHRVVRDWNNLPSHVVIAPSINSFKSRFDKTFKEDISKIGEL